MERWSSWFKAPVLKTGVPLRVPRVRIPISPPLNSQQYVENFFYLILLAKYFATESFLLLSNMLVAILFNSSTAFSTA